MNQLILGDNLEVLKSLASGSIDLIYLDPPFFSNRNYEVIWGDEGEIRSFKDRWAGGVQHYITWLKERVEEMYRLLKPTGSFYLHCDYHADAYIRVFILDKIFGEDNFRNQIMWHYSAGHSPRKDFKRKHDTIFRYTKGKNFCSNIPRMPYLEKDKYRFNRKDKNGKLYRINHIRDKEGKYKRFYWDEGTQCDDIWTYIRESKLNQIGSTSKERIGYPTQKPEALLERIIKASSNEGDIVLDPFMGGGTTIAVADRLKRNWIGIDQSVQAVKVTELRLQKQKDMFSKPFAVQLHKYDYDTLRYQDAFEFETWIIDQFGGEPNTKQRGDFGIDGQKDRTPIQVKRSDNIGRNVVDNFASAVRRHDKNRFEKCKREASTAGYIIAFSFGKGAVQEVARLKNEDHILIELVEVADIVPLAEKPQVKLEMEDLGLDAKDLRILEFKATSKNEIVFYAWDWGL